MKQWLGRFIARLWLRLFQLDFVYEGWKYETMQIMGDKKICDELSHTYAPFVEMPQSVESSLTEEDYEVMKEEYEN